MEGCKSKLSNSDRDGIGEVCFWGRNVFMGYLNLDEQTTSTIDEDGWLHSGDLGKFDSGRFLYITGRIKGNKTFLFLTVLSFQHLTACRVHDCSLIAYLFSMSFHDY